MKHRYLTLALSAAIAVLAGCEESAGYIDGAIRGSGEPVSGAFKSQYDGAQATAALLLDVQGQRYSGNVVPIGAATTVSQSLDIAAAFNSGYYGSNWNGGSGSSTTYAYRSTATFGAMLQGDKGGMMRCDLHASSPGTFKSGMGSCQTSDDKIIDLAWSPDKDVEAKLGIHNGGGGEIDGGSDEYDDAESIDPGY